MLALKSINKQALIDFEDLLFMLVEKNENTDWSQLYYVDAVIINSADSAVFTATMKGIRGHFNPNVYLKPIFASDSKALKENQIKCCDGLTDLTHYDVIAERTRAINRRVEKIFQLQYFPSPEKEQLFKTLQFLYTREQPLLPIPNRFSRINYSFPFLSRQFSDDDSHKILKILKIGKQEGYLAPEVEDKIHLCSSCDSAHHNIRETCRECGSVDLEIEDLIHHFQCAYIGPESDFKQEGSDQLICPKCAKHVRHIGIDYDKPSHIYSCNSCSATFQEANFTSHCMDCGDIKDVRHLKEEAIERLHLTSKGEQIVLRGIPKVGEQQAKKSVKMVTGIYSYEIFQHLLRQEEARIRNKGGQSVYGNVRILDEQLNMMTEEEVLMLQNELAQVLKSYVRDSDMISAHSPTEYHFLLTDTTIAESNNLKATIEFNFGQLISGNVKDSQPEIIVELMLLGDVKLPPINDEPMN
ncbi:MAG: hypothetical protein AAGG75_28330 [Bacteroidota bacterium]